MTDQLLFLLRLGLLAIVYLTFFRVLRAVWVELRTENRVAVPVPASMPATKGSPPPIAPVVDDRKAGSRLIVLTPPTVAGQVFELQAETTIGAGIQLRDRDRRRSRLQGPRPLFRHDDRWMVEDLGSTNGTLVNDHVLDHPENVGPGDRVQVGEHVMELA